MTRACSVPTQEFCEAKERTSKSMEHPGLLNTLLSGKAGAWYIIEEEWALYYSLSLQKDFQTLLEGSEWTSPVPFYPDRVFYPWLRDLLQILPFSLNSEIILFPPVVSLRLEWASTVVCLESMYIYIHICMPVYVNSMGGCSSLSSHFSWPLLFFLRWKQTSLLSCSMDSQKPRATVETTV